MARARAQTYDGRSSDTVSVGVCVRRGIPRGHRSGVPVDRERERCCRESRENIK